MSEAHLVACLVLIGVGVLAALWVGLSWIDPPEDTEPTEHGDGEP